MMRAILCVVERFLLGVAAAGVILVIAGGVLWLTHVVAAIWPAKWHIDPQGKLMIAAGALALCGVAGIVLFGLYAAGTEIAAHFGLCRMGAK